MPEELVTLDDLLVAREIVNKSSLVVRTPALKNMDKRLKMANAFGELHLKMESMQITGSFKVRGLVNQFCHIPKDVANGEKELISMSAGNYGRAFAYACMQHGLKSTVCMPDKAPKDRAEIIKGYGSKVELVPEQNLQDTVDRHVSEDGMHFLHPFDDINIIAGYASIGFEILEDTPDVDVLVVCCGGGGLLSGIASCIKLSGHKCIKVIGVEPEGASSMYQSIHKGHPVRLNGTNTIARGLAPPYAGTITFQHIKAFADGIVLVSDDEIKRAMRTLFDVGLVVEPSGAAAFAAVQSNKIQGLTSSKVAVIISGSNIATEELHNTIRDL